MNPKQVLLLLLLGLALGGAGLMVWKKQKTSFTSQDRRMGGKVLGEFDVNAVGTLGLRHESNRVTVAKAGDLWVLKERADYPANFNTIADFVMKLSELKTVSSVPVGPSRLPLLDLVGPDQKGPGTLIELKDSAGKPLKSLLLGKKRQQQEDPNGPPMGGGDSGRYAMVDGKSDQVVLIRDTLWNAEPRVEDWLNKDFFKVEGGVKSIAVLQPAATNSWTVSRTNETGEWALAAATATEKLDPNQTANFASLLGGPSFNDVLVNLKPEETGLTNPVTATVTTFDGFTYTLKLAKKGDSDVVMQVAVAADLPKARTPGKDEKPEDKTKLDKDFTDKQAKLADKLKTEQNLGKWTYLAPKWTFEALLKERRELLSTNAPPAAPTAAVPALPPGIISPDLVVPPLAPPDTLPAPKAAPPTVIRPPSIPNPAFPAPPPPPKTTPKATSTNNPAGSPPTKPAATTPAAPPPAK